MLHGRKVAVVISAYNEETQIGFVIGEMPAFVDRIVVVNDASTDATSEQVTLRMCRQAAGEPWEKAKAKVGNSRYAEAALKLEEMFREEKSGLVPFKVVNADEARERIILLENLENGGKGMAQAVGYAWCREWGIDCVATMDGDGQMDPAELESICEPVCQGEVDYVKGNRLIHKTASRVIPKVRFFGNSVLSILTKMASGYWDVSDTQTGYSAISLRTLRAIRLDKIYPRYGVPNDMLVKCNMVNCLIKEIPIRPVYRVGETSKMNIRKVIPRMTLLLIKLFFVRLWQKYLLRDFHPLFLLYHFSFLLIVVDLYFIADIFHHLYVVGIRPPLGDYITFLLLSLTSFQSLTFAMWMDMMDNAKLYKK